MKHGPARTLAPPRSSQPVEYQYLIPFVLPASIKNGTKMGRGQLYLVTGTAGNPVTINHGLGRPPQLILILDNGSGSLGDRTITSRSSTQVVAVPSVTQSNAVWWLV